MLSLPVRIFSDSTLRCGLLPVWITWVSPYLMKMFQLQTLDADRDRFLQSAS